MENSRFPREWTSTSESKIEGRFNEQFFFSFENLCSLFLIFFLPPLFGSFVMLIITLKNLIEPVQNEREERMKESERELKVRVNGR